MSHLFDKSGAPDDDLKALEERLASARAPARDWERLAKPRRRPAPLIALAAALVLGIVYVQLTRKAWIETTEQTELKVAEIGKVTVEPHSRLRFIDPHHLELARGGLHAKVNAPPRLFVVDTPAAQAVDLGCEYRLTVDAQGTTRLEVLKGEVSLEGHGAASRVSAGAVCLTKKGDAPGVPRSGHSQQAFTQALDAWESHAGGIQPVLATAQKDDAVSLWNMIPRVDEQERPEVIARLKGVIEEPPKDVVDSDVVQLKPPAMESLWQAFP